MSVNFEYYKVFYYAAKYRNITAAANELSLTQPSVTRAIQNLEAQLGCRLFTRSKKGLALTTEGKMIYQRIVSACDLFFSAEDEIAHMKSVKTGLICIGADDLSIRREYFFSLSERFRKAYPQAKLRIVQKDGLELIDALETGALDFCVLADSSPDPRKPRVAAEYASSIEFRLIREYLDVAIVGKAFSHLAGRKITLYELSAYPLIMWVPNTATRNFFEEAYRQQGLTATPMFEFANIDFQILLTEHGFGYSFAPLDCVKEKIERGLILPLDLADFPVRRQLLLAVNRAKPLSFVARRFLDMLTVPEA